MVGVYAGDYSMMLARCPMMVVAMVMMTARAATTSVNIDDIAELSLRGNNESRNANQACIAHTNLNNLRY